MSGGLLHIYPFSTSFPPPTTAFKFLLASLLSFVQKTWLGLSGGGGNGGDGGEAGGGGGVVCNLNI